MNDSKTLYPLRFEPIIKDKIWGGRKLKQVLGKGESECAGESWELSGVKGNQSVVANGPLKGRKIDQLIDDYKAILVGNKVYETFGNRFPLLIKFIDAQEDLSIQVHPNDSQSGGEGKTEMWYILDADPHARLLSGFNRHVEKAMLKESIRQSNFESYMNNIPVRAGDTFLIEANQVHSIGAGVLLVEIQQTSDITYRIYDFNRKDDQGNKRELHVNKAFEVMDFSMKTGKVAYRDARVTDLANVAEFRTKKYKVEDTLTLKAPTEHFLAIIAVSGKGKLIFRKTEEPFRFGDTFLIPANIEITIKTDEEVTFLQTSVE